MEIHGTALKYLLGGQRSRRTDNYQQIKFDLRSSQQNSHKDWP